MARLSTQSNAALERCSLLSPSPRLVSAPRCTRRRVEFGLHRCCAACSGAVKAFPLAACLWPIKRRMLRPVTATNRAPSHARATPFFSQQNRRIPPSLQSLISLHTDCNTGLCSSIFCYNNGNRHRAIAEIAQRFAPLLAVIHRQINLRCSCNAEYIGILRPNNHRERSSRVELRPFRQCNCDSKLVRYADTVVYNQSLNNSRTAGGR